MNEADFLAWFDELATRRQRLQPKSSMVGVFYDREESATWLAEAESALAAVFAPSHPLRVRWNGVVGQLQGKASWELSNTSVFDVAAGVFEAGRSQLKSGRLRSMKVEIQAEDVADLLDQASDLCVAGYLAAATVIVGGALESHLLHLCVRAALSWSGSGSISKYIASIAQLRNAGTEIYSSADSKQVEAWGGARNDAAHSPGSFLRNRDDVRLMIEGVRNFLSKYP